MGTAPSHRDWVAGQPLGLAGEICSYSVGLWRNRATDCAGRDRQNPGELEAARGQRVPASYANFYIANAAVLVPTFNDPNDRLALGTLAELFRDRPVIGIHAVDLVWGLGTLHCLTHEQPA
jgi:agmatine/peptidylarginine deiminase